MPERVLTVRTCCLIGLALLVVRLGDLQLRRGAQFRGLAEQNRLRLVPELAPRGLVFDRVGRQLATTQTSYRVSAVPQELKDRQAIFARLAPILGVTPAELEKRFHQQWRLPFLPVSLTKIVPKSVALRVEEARLELPGIIVEPVVSRHYPLGRVAAHLIGYLSQPSAEEFPGLKSYGIQAQDLVGRAGLEHELDAYLRGRPGGSLIEVDHRARQVRLLGHRAAVPGQAVTLTIDAELQALIEQRFGGQEGAAVVMDPETGELLAVVSVPAFDPEAFAEQNNVAIRQFLVDERAPLMNRAALGVYAPGSIMKTITAMTGLETGAITPNTTVVCQGFVQIGDRKFHCWNRDGHGPVNLRRALTVSCNAYFLELGRRLGLQRIRDGYLRVGLGRPTGWPFEEQRGRLPEGRLSEGDVAMLAIGQGEILVTPMQAAVMASAIANGGSLVHPWLVRTLGGEPVAHPQATSVGWAPDHLRAVHDGMIEVLNNPEGTGIRAHSDKVRIAGKTGTAQTHIPGKTHGWFIGFCPSERPVAAMAIVAEHGGSGGDLPASIGKAVCEYLVEHARRDE